MARRTRRPGTVSSLLFSVLLFSGSGVVAEQKTPGPPAPGQPVVNRVLNLDGESDFLRVADSPSLHSFTNAITIETWFKAFSFYPDDGSVNSLIRKDIGEGGEDFLLRFRMVEGAPCVEMNAGLNVGLLRASHDFQVGRWYHLAGTYDGRTIAAYVNGVRIGSESASGRMAIDEADLYIGKGDPEYSYGEYFHGVLDEIRLWNVARSEKEIQAAMNTPLTGKEEGLVAYWNFDDGTADDLSGHGNDGLFPQVVESPRPDAQAAAEQTVTGNRPGSAPAPASPERARDLVVHIEEGISREIPTVPRLCDAMDIRKEKVDIGDCRLYCEQEGQGTPLVLLNGGPGATHHYFHPWFSRAVSFAKVIYYDQRGCGLSDYQPGKGYCLNQAVDDLEHLRRALDVEQWVVLGHSYGGLLAQCYAMKYPENIKGLVLVCASTGLHGQSMPSRERDFISRQEREKMSEIRKASGLSMAQLVYNNFLNGDWKRQSYYKPSRERIAQIALYEWVHDNNFNGIMSRSVNEVELAGAFEQSPFPTLIIEGTWDMSWNTDKPEQFHKNHPNAKLVMFQESGHNPFEDEPAQFFSVLKDFTGSLPQVSAEKLGQWKSYLAQWQEDKKKPRLPALKTSLEEAREAERKPADGSPTPGASGPPTTGAPGTNRVLEFDGKTSFVQVADSPSLHTFTNAITIETWFKAVSFNTQEGMINSLLRKNVASEEENFLLRFRTILGETCVQMSPGYGLGALSAPYPFATGKWYHLAGVYDGNSITAYVNGTKIGNQNARGRMSIDQSDLFIGKGDPEFPGGEYFHGALDEIRLWNVARSQKEIQATMSTPLTGKEKGLVAYWNFDDGTARDVSGHGLDGLTPERAPAAGRTTGEGTPGKFPQLAFHIWGSIPFSPSVTRKPLNQHILLTIRKDPRPIEEIAREVEASNEEVSGALSQLAKCDLVRQAGESRWVTNVPVFVKEELLRAHEIGLRYAHVEVDLLRDSIPALKAAYEQCQVSRYHPWSKTSLIVVGALCADFCVSDRVRFRRDHFDERFLPPRHPDGRRWGYWGEEVLAAPPSSRKYQFYQNVSSDSKGGVTRFGYYYLLDEKRTSPPSSPENLHGRPEGKIWLSLTTPANLGEICERTGLNPDTIKTALDTMSTWNPPGVIEQDGRYMPSIPILSADDRDRLLPEADRVAEIIFKQVTIPMEREMDEEAKRLGLRFPLPSGTSARDVALQILSEDGTISPIARPPVPWNFGVWGWNGRLAMWENVQ